MIGGVTRRTLPHLPKVPHLQVNRSLEYGTFYVNQVLINMKFCGKTVQFTEEMKNSKQNLQKSWKVLILKRTNSRSKLIHS